MQLHWRTARAAFLIIAVLSLSACGGGGGGGSNNGQGTAPPPPPPPPPATSAQVSVTVFDTLGRFVSGATTASGTATAATDANGKSTLSVVTGSERVVAVTKAGFAEQVKVVNLASGATSGQLEAMLIAREPAQPIDSIETGGSASGRDGVKVTFPANALVTATGQPVTGTVQVIMTPVNVADVDVDAFPGLFEGTPTGGARQAIVSYGTAELIPQQGGQKLQLAAGKTAEIELPLYVGKHQDGSTVAAGDTIALWSLDSATGLWKQEGGGTVVASATSPTGFALRATIAHFSWWNIDATAQPATVNLNVTATGTNVPAATLAAVSGTVVAGTGPSFTATDTATVGTARLFTLPGGATTRLEATAQFGDQFCRGSVDVTPAPNSTVNATIDMTCVILPTPRLVRPAGTTFTNSQSAVFFQIEIDGPTPDSVALLVDGEVVEAFAPQFFYRGFWDSSNAGEGEHMLTPRATRQGLSRTGNEVTVVVDRTAPRATTFAPETTIEVDVDTVFAVDFDETVTAAPLTVSNFVRLSVVPVGQSTPVNVPIDASLDGAGQQLTVRPTAALPLGEASLSWAGLHDPAGNAIAGTVAASWSVSRSQNLGQDLPHTQSANLLFTTDSNGVAFVVRRKPDDGNLQALRFDGTQFVPIGPSINERPVGGDFGEGRYASIAVAPDGTVSVAFDQIDAGGTNLEVVVRSFESAANSWQTLGTPFAVARVASNRQNSAQPNLAVDALNRPVLVFIGSGTSFILQGHRFDAGTWSSLGQIDSTVFGSAAGCSVAQFAALSLDSTGNPAVGYLCSDVFGTSLLAARHDGTAWRPLGGGPIDRVPSGIGTPIVNHAPDGALWLAWFRGNEVRLVRHDGTAFVPVPIDPSLSSVNGKAAFTFLNGDPVVAGVDLAGSGKIDVRRRRNGVWEPPALVPRFGFAPVIALRTSGDAVLLLQSESFTGRVSRVVFP